MRIEGLDTVRNAVKKGIPNVFLTGRFNFITIHYFYMIGMTMFWSAIIYAVAGGDLPYVDSLFLSSGACTQSGLNTVDINKINTAQQMIIYFLAMLCNPIVVHTSVVFIRLYWFERRFKDVVREARSLRRSRTRDMSRARTLPVRGDGESARSDFSSVRGKAIRLLRSTGRKKDATAAAEYDEKKDLEASKSQSPQSSENGGMNNGNDRSHLEPHPTPGHDSFEDVRLPQQMNAEQHIQFLENQRNPADSTTLFIPSPREFDRGGRVQSIDEQAGQLERQHTRYQTDDNAQGSTTSPQMVSHITFNEPEHPSRRLHQGNRATTFPRIETGKASTMDWDTYDPGHIDRGRSQTRRNSFLRTNSFKTLDATPYLSWQPTVARNSFFVNLTEEQREELGGIEYRALKTLALILLGYFFAFHILGAVCLTAWIYHHYGQIVTDAGQGRAWWGIFTGGSAFNDLGFTLTPDSMNSFSGASFPLLIMTYLIIIGNTGFPCMLRFVIWALSKCVPVGSGLWEELQFLLDHPRRCFTLLFPRAATWWLFSILVILNGLDLIFFVALDIHNATVDSLSGWAKFLDGLFQAASTRTAGFSVVNIANLHPGIQVSYLIMMYISVFPIAISMRRTNVYEEKSLGIYASAAEQEEEDKDPSYVSAHLRKQLSFDLWYVFLGLFIISIAEGPRIENTNEYAFTVFSILFEIVSAYGTVGLSLGYPGVNTSFSGQFNVVSKLVIIAMQIRGRHRGLPYELDRAILLPSESLHRKEAAEAEKILHRRRSSLVVPEEKPGNKRFRPETGLASSNSYTNGSNDGGNSPHEERHRRFTNRSQHSNAPSTTESHKSHVRSGLGNGMFKLAEATEPIKEETVSRTTSNKSH